MKIFNSTETHPIDSQSTSPSDDDKKPTLMTSQIIILSVN